MRAVKVVKEVKGLHLTVAETTHEAARVLQDAGFDAVAAQVDASALARRLLGWTMAQWAANARDVAPEGFESQLTAFVQRRSTHEPVAYITGVREFYGREFRVTHATLIPRPETELLVEHALEVLSGAPGPMSALGCEATVSTVVDVGTGSGCLAISLALERPSAQVIATDISADALAVARDNARRLGAGRVEFVQTSLLPSNIGPVDLIVTNPPYVAETDRQSLAPDVREFEPAAALFGGDDGLAVIRPLVAAARPALKPGGALVMEIGQGQDTRVAELLREAGYQVDRIAADLQGIPRVVVARA